VENKLCQSAGPREAGGAKVPSREEGTRYSDQDLGNRNAPQGHSVGQAGPRWVLGEGDGGRRGRNAVVGSRPAAARLPPRRSWGWGNQATEACTRAETKCRARMRSYLQRRGRCDRWG
jgi:hypothetical protein